MLKRLLTKRGLIAAAAIFTLTIALPSVVLLAAAWEAMGAAPDGARLDRMEKSSQWVDGTFDNPQPLWNDFVGSVSAMKDGSSVASPTDPVPVIKGDRSRFAKPAASGLRITWLGHSTQIIEIDGGTFLTDPIFGGRASPLSFAGPKVWYGPPIPLTELPRIDAVLISHDHYDHLQMETIKALSALETRFVVPLGVGAHLEYWGVPLDQITEVDWWDEHEIAGVKVAATPARHASGRHLLDQNRTLWAGYALIGSRNRAYFSGDTGLFPAMTDIGKRYGPFDVTMIEVGAYHKSWPDWHIGPEQALRGHEMVRGKVFLPVHWGLWDLALHGWTEPAERVLVEASRRKVPTYVPRPGESLEPATLPHLKRWWPDVAWETAAEHPIVSTGVPAE